MRILKTSFIVFLSLFLLRVSANAQIICLTKTVYNLHNVVFDNFEPNQKISYKEKYAISLIESQEYFSLWNDYLGGSNPTIPAFELANFKNQMDTEHYFLDNDQQLTENNRRTFKKRDIFEQDKIFSFRGDEEIWNIYENKADMSHNSSHQKDSINQDDFGLVMNESYDIDFFITEAYLVDSNIFKLFPKPRTLFILAFILVGLVELKSRMKD